jgi:hypothetical protein
MNHQSYIIQLNIIFTALEASLLFDISATFLEADSDYAKEILTLFFPNSKFVKPAIAF